MYYLLFKNYEKYTSYNSFTTLGTYHKDDHITHINYVWSCPMLKGFALTASIVDAQNLCISDHNLVISYFDSALLHTNIKLTQAWQFKRDKHHIFKLDNLNNSV